MPILSFQNIQKSYGDFQALKNVDFSVEEGKFVALLGSNGAGKTTLINCLSGALEQTKGKIIVDGRNTLIDSEYTKQNIGIVDQEITFDPFFSPIETLQMVQGFFGIQNTQENTQYLHWLLKKLSLDDKKDVASNTLSGGMKRRLMIAKALVHKPKILILDEPTAGVDIELRKNLWIFIKELQKKYNTTILLTTHYLEEAEAMADKTAILHNGEIIVYKDTKELMKNNNRKLCLTFQNKKVKNFVIEQDTDIMKNILEENSEKNQIINIQIKEPKLEEIFWEYTKK